MAQRIVCSLLLFLLSVQTPAATLEGGYLYRVTTVRAAPGKLSALLDAFRESGGNVVGEAHAAMLMRHSQGDQWDLLVITPMNTFAAHFGKDRVEPSGILPAHADLIAFEADVFALGPELDAVRSAYDSNGLYHIEMFDALPGMAGTLIEQRRMENRYLAATGQVPNMIFRRVAGGDVDVFTIGFHKSLEAFAAPAPANDDEKEDAAKDAGFRDRADISYYLRSLISGHHDTFAVRVD